jgi:hypothetical protein
MKSGGKGQAAFAEGLFLTIFPRGPAAFNLSLG